MTLLICDDDISTVDVIESHLDCAELGISRVLRAYNGEAAKEIIDRERPELVLCDIGMPLCDGIQVLKFVYDNQIETEFTFLTCHEDFEYAKAALRYGASYYLTKPFEMDELIRTLQSMIEASTEKKVFRVTQHQAQRDSVMNSVLRQVSYGLYGTNRMAVSAALRHNGLSISADSSWYMVLSCSDTVGVIGTGWDRERLMYALSRLHDETLARYIGSAYTLISNDERFIWCRCFVPREDCRPEELFSRCERLLETCIEHLSLHPAILVSDEFPLYEAASVFGQMSNKINKIQFPHGLICWLREADQIQREETFYLDQAYLLRQLKERSLTGCMDYFASMVHQLAVSEDYSREAMDGLRCELIYIITTCLRDNGLPPVELFREERVTELNARSTRSSEDMIAFGGCLFDAVSRQLQDLTDSADIMVRVEAYIKEHFRENINREDVAAVVYITPNYLSKLFRVKMGMNLREYINQIRIEEAKRMLLTTNLSVSEIAGHVGYDNISYFSTVFRKLIGMSPVDWRNLEIQGGGSDEDLG